MVIRRDFLQVNGRRLARGLCAIGLSAALAACGNGTSPGDAAVDVREDGDFNFPRSAFCARLEDSGYRYGFQSYCRLGAAEGERCKFDPTIDTSESGYCVSVTASTGGAFAAYDRAL